MHFTANTVALILSVSTLALANPIAEFDDSVQLAPRSPGADFNIYAREADPEAFGDEEDEYIYSRSTVPSASKIKAIGKTVEAAVKASDKNQEKIAAAAQDKVNAEHSKDLFPNGRGGNTFKPSRRRRSVYARSTVPSASKIKAIGKTVEAAVKASDKNQEKIAAAAQDKVNAEHSKDLFPNGRGGNTFKPSRRSVYVRSTVPSASKIKAIGKTAQAVVNANDKSKEKTAAAAQDKVNAEHSKDLFPNGRGGNTFKPARRSI